MADLYAAVTDDAVNRIAGFVHARAPYLFNYVAPSIRLIKDEHGILTGIEDLWLTCSEVAPDPPPGTPRYRRIPPLQLPMPHVDEPLRLPCSIQLINVKIDFHPGDTLNLPPPIPSPLRPQRFALHAAIQFGLPCMPASAFHWRPTFHDWRLPVLPVESLECFLIDIFAVGHLVTTSAGTPPVQRVGLELDGLEVVDVRPPGLEQVIECYLEAMLKGYILPELVLALEAVTVHTLGLEKVTPTLSAGLPANPAVEHNELRVWLDLAYA